MSTADQQFRKQLRDRIDDADRECEQTRHRVLDTLHRRARRQRRLGLAVVALLCFAACIVALVNVHAGIYADRDVFGRVLGFLPVAMLLAAFFQFFVFWRMPD